MTARGKHAPNTILRQLREERGWSLRRVADELCLLAEAEDESRLPGVNANMVGIWERGWKRPSPFYQALFCQLYHCSASQLGFVSHEAVPPPQTEEPQQAPIIPAPLPSLTRSHDQTHAIDLLCHVPEATPQQQAGAWLTLGASGLGQLFNEGWTLDEILTSVQMVLQGIQAISSMSRRQSLQLGTAAVISGIPMPASEKCVSEEERVKLCNTLGESVASGWQIFGKTENAQVLAVGYAQLYLVQQTGFYLYPDARSVFYSAVYRLIGAGLHFQGQYDEAYRVHEKAYIAALEGGDVWNIAQSRSWQANGLRDQRRYSEALQAIEASLRLIALQEDRESIRLRAHLHACIAEMAAFLGETEQMQKHLRDSEALLGQIPLAVHEEFDHASWHQYRGTCALILQQYELAAIELQQASAKLPALSPLRHVTTLMPLAIVHARRKEREEFLAAVEKAMQMIKVINAPGINRQFMGYIQIEAQRAFPDDTQIHQLIFGTQT